MSRNRYALVTAAGLAAVALSACSGTGAAEPKPWPAEGKVAAAPTSATVRPATNNWVGLPDQPVPDSQRDISLLHPRFSATAAPGVGVWEQGTNKVCTLGPVIAPTMSPTSRGYLTAKHCDQPSVASAVIYADAAHTDPRTLGVYTPRNPEDADATSLWVSPGVAAPASIAGHPVAGVLNATAVKALASGSSAAPKVCVYGAVSGLVCGDLIDANDKEVTVDITTRDGDSGGAVFLYDEATHAATLIGLASSGSGSYTYGVLAETALRELGAQVVTDPAAAATVRGDSRYVTSR